MDSIFYDDVTSKASYETRQTSHPSIENVKTQTWGKYYTETPKTGVEYRRFSTWTENKQNINLQIGSTVYNYFNTDGQWKPKVENLYTKNAQTMQPGNILKHQNQFKQRKYDTLHLEDQPTDLVTAVCLATVE